LKSRERLARVFTSTSKVDYEWEFYLSPSDDHYTTPLNTFNKGLASYFSGYAPIRFYSITKFKSFGGMAVLKEHYKKRGETQAHS
jgi:hypothetical protein